MNDLYLCEAAIHEQFRSCDIAAVIGGEKHHGADELGEAREQRRHPGALLRGVEGVLELVAAGLDVRLLVPRMSDSRLVTLAARSYFGPLLVAGVKVYEYGPRMLHTKSLLVDDTLALIGSANFDHRSFRLNFEVSVLFDDAALVASLAQLIEGELAHAPRVRQGRHRGLLTARLPEALARLLSPLL